MSQAAAPLRALLIDDDPDDRALVLLELRRAFPGLHAVEVGDPAALERALQGEWDVAVTDYQLRWSDGLAVLEALKARRPDAPVLMFTGTGSEELAAEAMKRGLDDYLVKRPGRYALVPLAVGAALRRAESERRREHAEAAVRLLAAEGTGLAAALTLDETLRALAGLAVPQVADRFAVFLLDEEGRPRAAGALPEGEALPGLPPELLAAPPGAEPPALVHGEDGTSLYTRLAARGRTHGALAFHMGASGRRFGEPERALAEAFSRRAALAVDNTLLYAAEQDARRAAEHALAQAEQASRAKSQFLATMSHELRTPINAVIGYADLLEVGIAGVLSPGQLGYVERIRASGQHLLSLVTEVLDLARVEAGLMDVRAEVAEVREAVLAALSLTMPQAAARNLAIGDEGDCYPAVRYLGDPERVRQVLANLLTNAVKFTEPGGRVTVRCRVAARPPGAAAPAGEGPWVGIEVEDTGIGIAPDQLARVFEPFTQVESGYTRSHGGIGLGLAISRDLARLMGGELLAESEPGRGSRFTLWLRAVPVAGGIPDFDAGALAWPTRPGEVPGLAEAGRRLGENAEAVVRRWADRLGGDPAIPGAAGLGRAQLENHMVTVLVEIGRTLVALDEGSGEPALMRDASDIQRLVAERHGEQRARLGWTPAEVAREYRLLGDEVEEMLGEVEPGGGAARALLRRLLHRAEEISVRALEARTEQEQGPGG